LSSRIAHLMINFMFPRAKLGTAYRNWPRHTGGATRTAYRNYPASLAGGSVTETGGLPVYVTGAGLTKWTSSRA